MSTNNRWKVVTVKSEGLKFNLKLEIQGSGKSGNDISGSALQKVIERGRPGSDDKGQGVSCRLSGEELRHSLPAVSRALTQIIAERRRQGVALFRKFAETREALRRG